jgi:uncharacterized protein
MNVFAEKQSSPEYPADAILKSPVKAAAHVEALDWESIGKSLNDQGSAVLPGVLSSEECRSLASLYSDDGLFRSRAARLRQGRIQVLQLPPARDH